MKCSSPDYHIKNPANLMIALRRILDHIFEQATGSPPLQKFHEPCCWFSPLLTAHGEHDMAPLRDWACSPDRRLAEASEWNRS